MEFELSKDLIRRGACFGFSFELFVPTIRGVGIYMIEFIIEHAKDDINRRFDFRHEVFLTSGIGTVRDLAHARLF